MGFSSTFVSNKSLSIATDLTSDFMIGRRIRAYCGIDGYRYGTILNSVFSSPNTIITLTNSSDDITTNLLSVEYGVIGNGSDQSMPIHDHAGSEGTGGSVNHDNLLNVGIRSHNNIDEIFYDRSEPTGFIDRTTSTITFSNSTSALSISGDFYYYIKGIKYNVNEVKTKKILGQGNNFFYFDSNMDLQVTNIFSTELLLKNNVYVTAIYWDDIDKKRIYFGDERHSIEWDWNLHSYHHTTEGTKYQTGLGLIGVSAFSPIEQIYNSDDTLWTLTILLTAPDDFVDSNIQNHTTGGTQSLDFSGSENGDIAQFSKDAYIDLTEYDNFSGWIYITSWGTGDNIQFYGWDTNADSIVGNLINLSDYVVEANLNTWQQFSIPLTDMGLNGQTIDAIRIQMVGAGFGGFDPTGFLDDLSFGTTPLVSDDDLTIGIGSGIIRDEDIVISIDEITKGSSSFVVFYREGGNGDWTHDGPTSVLFKNFSGGSNRVAWNEFNGSVWQQSEVANGEYTIVHIFATNDIEHPIIGIQSQTTFASLSSARTNVLIDIRNIITGDMPFQEFTPIGSIVIHTDSNISNTYKANFSYLDSSHTQTWEDFRAIKGASTGNISINDHGNLSGLGDDDHPQYLNQNRGDIRYSPINHKHSIQDLWTYDSITPTTSGNTIALNSSIPSATMEIEIIFNQVSTNTNNQPPIVRLGDSGGIENTEYLGRIRSDANGTNVTDGLYIFRPAQYSSSNTITGRMKLLRWDFSSNLWIVEALSNTSINLSHFSGYKETSEILTTIIITTPGGSATFDNGLVRIRYR